MGYVCERAGWTIFNGNKNKSAARKAKIELEKSQMQLAQMISQNQMQYELTKRKMMEAEQKINLAEKAIEQSRESLRIKTDRFAEGLERTTDILMAETTVAQKEMELVEAVFSISNSIFRTALNVGKKLKKKINQKSDSQPDG